MWRYKNVKFNKKVKLKSLKQIIDICIKNNMIFTVDKHGEIDIEDASCNEVTFSKKMFGKEIKFDDCELIFNSDNQLHNIHYESKGFIVHQQFTKFFVSFPKLTKGQKTPPIIPPPPKVIKSLLAGKGHDNYTMSLLDNGTLKVGCNEFTKKQLKNIKEFLKD